jgi:hypothetical protein
MSTPKIGQKTVTYTTKGAPSSLGLARVFRAIERLKKYGKLNLGGFDKDFYFWKKVSSYVDNAADLEHYEFIVDLQIMGSVHLEEVTKAILERYAEPIFNKEVFSNISFEAPRLIDSTMQTPTDALSSETKDTNIPGAAVHFFDYKVRSFYKKFVVNDPYKRFEGNSSDFSDWVPSFYSLVETGFYDKDATKLTLNSLGKKTNYGSHFGAVGNQDVGHIVFYDYDAYITFLQGCNEIASNKLRSLAKYYELYSDSPRIKAVGVVDQLPDLVPFYLKTEFTTEQSGLFTDFLTSAPIQPFFEQLLSLYTDLSRTPKKYEEKDWLKEQGFSIIDGTQTQTAMSKVININGLLKDKDFFNFQLVDENPTKKTPCTNIQKKLSSLLFTKKIKNFSLSNAETICYRVTKTDKFTGRVTHWIIPNSPQLDQIELFDSNIRFNRGDDAKYEVFSLKVFFGATIKLGMPANAQPSKSVKSAADLVKKPGSTSNTALTYYDDNGEFNLAFSAERTTQVSLIEVPYFLKEDVVIYDAPPARPNIALYSYKGVDNKITALFSGYIDQYKAKKEPILLGEAAINNKSEKYARQHYRFAKDELYHKTEMEDIDLFELFILESRPKSLKDFRTAKRIEIKNTADPIEISKLKAAKRSFGSSYTFDILPNKNYWLMARVKDFNGNISNSSIIKKLNIINDDGYINPTIESYDMDKRVLPKEVSVTPPFKKLVSISPSLGHLMIAPSGKDNIDIGEGESQPFSKTYKIRIRSKKTNKKVDINVYFEKKIEEIKSKKELPDGFEYTSVDLRAEDPFYPEDFINAEKEKANV